MYNITSGQPVNTKQRPIFQTESESHQDSLSTLSLQEIQKTEGLVELPHEGKIIEIQL